MIHAAQAFREVTIINGAVVPFLPVGATGVTGDKNNDAQLNDGECQQEREQPRRRCDPYGRLLRNMPSGAKQCGDLFTKRCMPRRAQEREARRGEDDGYYGQRVVQ